MEQDFYALSGLIAKMNLSYVCIFQETEHNAYNMALVRIQRNMERGANRTSSISSENFSSRSDSWRQGSIPFKLIDRNGQRKSSWGVTRKASQVAIWLKDALSTMKNEYLRSMYYNFLYGVYEFFYDKQFIVALSYLQNLLFIAILSFIK